MERTSNPLLHRLQQTLETNASREEVAEALAAAEALGDGLPPLLAYRARERIDADRFLDRRRICFGVGCALVVFLAPFSAIGLTTLDRLRAANRDVDNFQQLIDDGRWDEAQAFLDSLDDATRSRQQFADGEIIIQEELERERQRTEEFQQLVQQIRADTSGTVDEEAVSRLDELARSEEERAIAVEMAGKADEQRLNREAARVNDQTQHFENLQQSVDDFFQRESKVLSNEARTLRMRELRQQLQQFVSDNHLSNPELTEAAKQTAALLGRENERAQARNDKQESIAAMTVSVGNSSRFIRSAEQFANSFPEDAMAKELTKLVANRKPIEATEAWIKVHSHAAFTSPATAESDASQQWLELLDHASKLDAEHPLSQDVLQWRDDYEAITKRPQALKQLRELLQSKLLGRMYVYPDLRGGLFYSDAPPQRDSPTAHVVEYFSDLSLNRQTKNFGSRYQEQIFPRVQLAGHSSYAAKAYRMATAIDTLDFTPGVYRLINDLRSLDVGTEIDPILRLDLTRRLLETGVRGSVPIADGFEDWKTSLEASDFPWDANWMAPGDDDPKVAEAREEAKKLLQSAADWDERVKRMGESFRRFRDPRGEPPEWIGWVAREGDRYLALLRTGDNVQGELFVLAPDPARERSSFIKIGTAENRSGQTIDEAAAQSVGAPICVFPAAKTTPLASADAS